MRGSVEQVGDEANITAGLRDRGESGCEQTSCILLRSPLHVCMGQQQATAFSLSTGDRVVFTSCSTEHSHSALSCKMAAEFDAFLSSDKR